MVPEIPSPNDPHLRHMRRLFLAVITGSFLFLIPWIAYLSASLPSHHEVDQWRLAWVGFDGALIVAIGVTALCAWRRRQIFIPWAIVTATLLCCDAWFDIVLDWNSDELLGSVVTAVVAELPLAALLLYVARKMLRLTVTVAWQQAGREGPVPPLSRLPLMVLQGEGQEVGRGRGGPRHDRPGDPLGGRPHPDGGTGDAHDPRQQPRDGAPTDGRDARDPHAPHTPYDLPAPHDTDEPSGRNGHGPHVPHGAHRTDPDGEDRRARDARREDAGHEATDREQPDDDRRHPPRRSA
ncbi:hypothetical protein [Actinacidiphila rubida]|uniref:Uncharacterized protein n=1 Tax=Actinacidiphila rubida TaxID=310780 RepID=A0A1H8JWB3_9ACTN|nr:hypothetical protein [Actinacidiphila rubida]SEN84795.1 hypothetical protein SAMN05216267_101175 [Actinacidiphila rubida]